MPHSLPIGVVAPLLTPFNHDGSLARDLYVDRAKALIEDGCAGLAPFGTTGEALSLGVEERMQALEWLVDGGINPKSLIPGTGLTNLPDTVKLALHATKLGCAGCLVLPPFYYKGPSENGLYRYYSDLIEQVGEPDLRIYLYHIPQIAGVGIPMKLAAQLFRDFPSQIVGIKDSSGNWENTKAFLAIEGLIVYPSSELSLIEALALGARGCISATANLNAGNIARAINLIQAEEPGAIKVAMAPVRDFREKMQKFNMISAQKHLLARKSGDIRWANIRPPLDPLDRDEENTVERLFADYLQLN